MWQRAEFAPKAWLGTQYRLKRQAAVPRMESSTKGPLLRLEAPPISACRIRRVRIHIGDIDEDSSYPLVADSIIDELHHDIISTWTQVYAADGIEVVVMAGDGEPWISVTSEGDDDFCIVVENGIWYNAY